MGLLKRVTALYAVLHAAFSAWAAPGPGSPANGLNASDLFKSGILPIIVFVLAHIGVFVPGNAAAIAAAAFALDLLRRYGPPGIPTVAELTAELKTSGPAAPQEALPPAP